MGSFYDYTSSNNYGNLYLQTDYTITSYVGYTTVKATSYIVVKVGSWNFTTWKNSTNPQLSINGSTSNLVKYEVKVGSQGGKYRIATNTVNIYHTTNKTINISSSINLSGVTISSTGRKVGTYSLSGNITLVPKQTACSAPTSFSCSPNDFENTVNLTWSGAKAGTGSAIRGYEIHYRTSSNNSSWRNWATLNRNIVATGSSGSYSYTSMQNLVARGDYVQFRIRTLTNNSNYYSSWATSNSIRRKPYTSCTSPTIFTISQNDFDVNIVLSWSGAGSGTNNAITSYYIQYCLSSNNLTWGDWIGYQTISTTKTSHSLQIDGSFVQRGQYVKFRIRTQGSAGSSYYSGYKTSDSIRRNPYTACIAPTQITVVSEQDLKGDTYNNIFNNTITISWSGAQNGENQPIESYKIEYRKSSDNITWSDDWQLLVNIDTKELSGDYTQNISDLLSYGYYIQFSIQAVPSNTVYASNKTYSIPIKRNVPPSKISDVLTNLPSAEYSYGNDIVISWYKPEDEDDNIYKYRVILLKNDNGIFKNIFQDEIIGKNNVSYTLKANDSIYKTIANNQQIKFAVTPIDNFGILPNNASIDEMSAYTETVIITRYDLTGVSMGINGKWTICQLFVGTNGEWVEQEVAAGINDNWIDAEDAS